MDTEQTRAAIARRRLAQLVASFDETHVRVAEEADSSPADAEPVPVQHRRVTGLHARLAVAAAVAVAVVLAWSLLAGRPTSVPAHEADGGAEPSETVVETGQIVIDVVGHVQRPGIVTLPAGSRVHEAIAAAGGLVGEPDTTGLNLARRLEDGEQLLVGVAPVSPQGATAADGRTNLNSATLQDLDDLPGVGPVTAAAIVDWRDEHGPFRSVDDLLEVRGIGQATLDELRDLVTV